MSQRRPAHRLRGLVALSALLLGASVLTACDNGPDIAGGGSAQETAGLSSGSESSNGASSGDDTTDGPNADVDVNVERNATDVPVDTELTVTAKDGTLQAVSVSGSGDVGTLDGELAGDGSGWKAGDLLEPGTTYTVRSSLEDPDGETVTRRQKFTTQALSLDEQTYPSVAPLPGETVGVGMPVIVTFDLPVTDKAAFEKRMHVTSSPQQIGSWRWISDTEAHYRPKTYWQAGTTVDVDVDVNGVDAGDGVYGQESRDVSFEVGDANIYEVNMKTDQMKVTSNGQLLRTIPITTGEQPKFTTRSGVKVIIEKFESKDMNSETVGITGADAYNIAGVKWAMRLTYSGEFIHAAPWSVASQGHANVSHGCTGMSTEDADWLYHMTKRGDVVDYTGTDRSIEPGNGYDDWNVSWRDYKAGSAL
ncbi:L,D-transpeptidase [Nocardioides flavescens]|uniref:L,D-transpeptidase family protein n=1 Tax=Nocardioides flavescens TaxID=2691959 RepID=A0A6L7F4J2_9ACTN|nr:Ig-like domain-containing protein [Nocardioides flavescens]MXG92150.1 L,D-transpeptidase family protein [Nocardioides flavescens]